LRQLKTANENTLLLSSRMATAIDSESTQLELLRSGVEPAKVCHLTELLIAKSRDRPKFGLGSETLR
jgi:hypothetical protein